MEPNENLKPQPTGGLKLMTVFIAVLALHVVVIGGFTVWHVLYPSGTDADLTLDKTHKGKIVADSSIGDMPASDSATTDKTAAATTTSPGPTDSSTATTDAASPSADTADTMTPPAATATTPTPTVAAGTTPMPPASLTPPVSPELAEDASSTAANPPVTTPTPTHPAVVTTPDIVSPLASSAATPVSPAAGPTTPQTSAAPVVATTVGTSYTVKRGDSLARIARRHHLTLTALRSANSLKSDRLHLAQVLIIPSRAPKAALALTTTANLAPAATTATQGEAAEASDTLPVATPAPATEAVATTATPHHAHAAAAVHHLYTVVRGDTLTKIAKRYHTTTSALVAANGLTNAGRLSIGQKLHIPSHDARGSATAEGKPIDAEPHGATRAQLANIQQ